MSDNYCEICYACDDRHAPACMYHSESCRESELLAENASLRARLAGVEKVGEAIDGIRDFACCDVSSKFCGWKESIGEVVSAYDALARLSSARGE